MNDESTYKHKKYWCAEVESYLSQKAVLAFSLNQPLDFHPTSNISTVLNWCNSFLHVPNFKAHYLWNNTKKTTKKNRYTNITVGLNLEIDRFMQK